LDDEGDNHTDKKPPVVRERIFEDRVIVEFDSRRRFYDSEVERFVNAVLDWFRDNGTADIIPFLREINEGNPPLWKRNKIAETIAEIQKRAEQPM